MKCKYCNRKIKREYYQELWHKCETLSGKYKIRYVLYQNFFTNYVSETFYYIDPKTDEVVKWKRYSYQNGETFYDEYDYTAPYAKDPYLASSRILIPRIKFG